ncbi:hypothetical protein LF1_29840 [Rubripirellula obstinata]|uniref:Probable pectate lyase C n=1 Tax=Rubripirellula obstinata TaxID=406547 RepID=A0A5B1CM80_9BACT|nr:choice-of-anchor Q domain-containing protein [Rubripirellula obstinata]KAA1260444.1 hypothetical protein LF1_29840 [Rubripirellula obstinata]
MASFRVAPAVVDVSYPLSHNHRKTMKNLKRSRSRKRRVCFESLEDRRLLAAVTGFTDDFELGNWFNNQVIDNGITSISPASGPAQQATFGYELELDSGGFSQQQTVNFLTSAASAGTVSLDYQFSGNSRFFRAGAQFDTVSGDDATTIVDETTNGGFSFSGSATIDARQGEEFGFRIGGGNSDTNRNILGNLTVTNIVFDFDNTIVVDSGTDIDDGDITPGNVSLREAVRMVNEVGYIDTITFDDSLAGSTITLTEGDLRITSSITVQGPGADQLTISGGGQSRIFNEVGNGVRIITINDVTLADGNSPSGGGGALFSNGGNATFNRVVMTGNRSQNNGTAVVVGFGRLTINDSAIINNLTAGIGAVRVQESITAITNTTISGNNSRGISLFSSGVSRADSLSLTNVTIANNAGDAIEIVANAGTVLFEYQNTIFADDGSGNGNGAERFSARGNSLEGLTITSLGHNLVQQTPTGNAAHDAATGDLRDVGALLAPLADNGGPTPTHSLREGSLAIDAGSNALAVDSNGDPLLSDQRGEGFARISGGTADIGAFELDNSGPQVESIVINNGDVQRSTVQQITVGFSEIVATRASDFLLENLDSGSNITPEVSTQDINGKTIATLTFSGDGIFGGSLSDGNYRLTVLDTVSDASGNTLDTDGVAGENATDEFFRLYGDASGDGTVGLQDFASFRSVFGNADAALDFDNDGVVGLTDFAAFRSNFGKSA